MHKYFFMLIPRLKISIICTYLYSCVHIIFYAGYIRYIGEKNMFYNFTGNPFMFVLIAILVFENLQRYVNNPSAIVSLLLSIPGILIAITFHEFAHAYVADKLGDDTPRRQGRLTLNPLSHLDPFGVLLLLFAGFGWGKPVQINPNNFNRKVSIKKGNALVSLAGPAMNLVLAIIFSIIYGLLLRFSGTFILTTTGDVISQIITYAITMNVGLCIFNLIPLPPLDGSKILKAVLPEKSKNWFEKNEKILYIIFLVIWLTPISTMIIGPAIHAANNALIKLISLSLSNLISSITVFLALNFSYS